MEINIISRLNQCELEKENSITKDHPFGVGREKVCNANRIYLQINFNIGEQNYGNFKIIIGITRSKKANVQQKYWGAIWKFN